MCLPLCLNLLTRIKNYCTDSLQMKKYTQTTEELADLEGKLAEAAAVQEAGKAGKGQAPEDDLDSFMHSLKFQVPDKHKRVTWKVRLSWESAGCMNINVG